MPRTLSRVTRFGENHDARGGFAVRGPVAATPSACAICIGSRP
jgi:hypothetical protein